LLGLLHPPRADGWIAYSNAIVELEREDLTGPLEALLDEEAHIEALEFDLVPQVDDENQAPPEPIVIEIPSELRVDLEVQQAARAAMLHLRGIDYAPLPNEDDDETSSPDDPEGDGEATMEWFEADPEIAHEEPLDIAQEMPLDSATLDPALTDEPEAIPDPNSEMELETDAE
ncbi:MAG: hypothetical protein QF464_20220, partial [Myxococcota bacterium]|nr:hypothetical protein [Myxococcota bacterium]